MFVLATWHNIRETLRLQNFRSQRTPHLSCSNVGVSSIQVNMLPLILFKFSCIMGHVSLRFTQCCCTFELHSKLGGTALTAAEMYRLSHNVVEDQDKNAQRTFAQCFINTITIMPNVHRYYLRLFVFIQQFNCQQICFELYDGVVSRTSPKYTRYERILINRVIFIVRLYQ